MLLFPPIKGRHKIERSDQWTEMIDQSSVPANQIKDNQTQAIHNLLRKTLNCRP